MILYIKIGGRRRLYIRGEEWGNHLHVYLDIFESQLSHEEHSTDTRSRHMVENEYIVTSSGFERSLVVAYEAIDKERGTASEIMQALHGQLQASGVFEERFVDSINGRYVRIQKMNLDELQFQQMNFTGRRRGRQIHSRTFSNSFLLMDRKQRVALVWIRHHISKILSEIDIVGMNVFQTDFEIND